MMNVEEKCAKRRSIYKWRFARIDCFKARQSLANRFVRVGEIIDFHAKSQIDPVAQKELRRETWRAFIRSINEGFFEHDGSVPTRPQIRLWWEESGPRRIDREAFRAIETHDEEFVESHFPSRLWLPVAAALRWCKDQKIEPKEGWLRAVQEIELEAHSRAVAPMEEFRTGAAGRPSPIQMVEREAERRRKTGEAIPAISRESEALHQWCISTYPKVPAPKPKTIANRIRESHSAWKSSASSPHN